MLFIGLVLIIQSCGWLEKREQIEIIGDYAVGWNDLESNRCIRKSTNGCSGCYSILVEGYVYGVGHNENFIIVKQHPNPDTSVTNYYVIDVAKNSKQTSQGINGPLSKSRFEELLRELKISHLAFDLNFDESPKL